jgi:predicted Zn-ribbon and HTH transcriptional regulator
LILVQLWESKKEKKLVGEVSKVQTQGSVELGGEKKVESYQEKEGIYENKQEKVYDPQFCIRCKSEGHLAKDCRRGWQQNRFEKGNVGNGNRKALSYLIAPLCATQAEGQAFLVIPKCLSEINARERVNTVVVTILKGVVTAKLIEEFT